MRKAAVLTAIPESWAVVLVRRLPHHPAILPVATAVAMVGVLVPARTFQGNYLAAVAGMLATGWLVVGDRASDPSH